MEMLRVEHLVMVRKLTCFYHTVPSASLLSDCSWLISLYNKPVT